MKKLKLLCAVFALILLLPGCQEGSGDTVGKIIPPDNRLMPVAGRWKIEGVLHSNFTEVSDEDREKWASKPVQFSEDFLQIGQDFFEAPQYKVKSVRTDEYLLYRHKQPAEKYGIEEKEIIVVTVAARDIYSVEAVLLGEDKLIIELEDFILYLSRISKEVDYSLIDRHNENSSRGNDSVTNNRTLARTGLVLGLKYASRSSGGEVEYRYRTLWIGSEDKKLHPILETEGIFFPRHDGFWRIEEKKINMNSRSENVFYAYSVLNGNSAELRDLSLNAEKWGNRTGNITRSISYICNDYIVIESNGRGGYETGSGSWNQSSIQLQLVNNLPNLKGIKISDIAGDTGYKVLNSGKREALSRLDGGNIKVIGNIPQDENYGLFRVAGHWLFKGRLEYENQGVFKYQDFNINIIPSSELVFYDDLWIPWTQIKDRVPEAIDAYTSPNRDIAVIVTRDRVLVFEINKDSLGDNPIKKINLKNNEAVIMAEWARGSYMDSWENSFKKNEIKEIK